MNQQQIFVQTGLSYIYSALPECCHMKMLVCQNRTPDFLSKGRNLNFFFKYEIFPPLDIDSHYIKIPYVVNKMPLEAKQAWQQICRHWLGHKMEILLTLFLYTYISVSFKAFTSYLILHSSSRKVDANCNHEWNSINPFGGELTHLGIFTAWKQTHNYWFPGGVQSLFHLKMLMNQCQHFRYCQALNYIASIWLSS